MTRNELLLQLDDLLGLRAGTIRGSERLDEIENWDSSALINFIVMAEATSGVRVSLHQLVACSTIADLLRVTKVDGDSV
jgi:hypothetical protein